MATGWLHVYAVPASGGPPQDLISGECEAQDFISNGNYVYISHNCDLLDSRGILRVNMVDGSRTKVFAGNLHAVAGLGDSGYGMAPVSSGLVYSRTSFNTSTQVYYWQAATGKEILLSKPQPE